MNAPYLTPVDGGAYSNRRSHREDSVHRANRGFLASATGDKQDIIGGHGHVIRHTSQNLLEVHRNLRAALHTQSGAKNFCFLGRRGALQSSRKGKSLQDREGFLIVEDIPSRFQDIPNDVNYVSTRN